MKKLLMYASSITFVVLLLAQAGFSYYRTTQAEEFVNSISGTWTGEIEFFDDVDNIERDVHADIYVHWEHSDVHPPSCPASVYSILVHESGLAVLDIELLEPVSSAAIKAGHKVKNGNDTIEPIYSQDAAHALRTHPGQWEYILVFKFHCSIVNSDWLSFIKFDKSFEAKPVVFTVE